MPEWHESSFSGIFDNFAPIQRRAHDPEIFVTLGKLALPDSRLTGKYCGGADWNGELADEECLGEALKRVMARPVPMDALVKASQSDWPKVEPPSVPIERFILFHPNQYASQGFPFQPLTKETVCSWTRCHEASTGREFWVPEELVFLQSRPGTNRSLAPGIVSGLSAGQSPDLVILRGAQEAIEHDGLINSWTGFYPLEEWYRQQIRPQIEPDKWDRIERPNLKYRFYRVETPYSEHVTLVTLEGPDTEGWIFSVGSACRETRKQSWEKSILDAIQMRYRVRKLLDQSRKNHGLFNKAPSNFTQHSLYYTANPQRLEETIFQRAKPPELESKGTSIETMAILQQRLGSYRPVLFRITTPQFLCHHFPQWVVARVLIPGLRPLHGDHHFPYLGSSNFHFDSWNQTPPHAFV